METIVSSADLANFAQKIITQLQPGDVVALEGPLAAGKTTFTKALLKAMGYEGYVSSPTFTIEQRYPVDWHGIKTVIHLDLYRLKEADLGHFDWDEYLAPNVLTVIEWPAIAKDYLPPHTKRITIEILNEKERRFTTHDFTD